MNDQYGSMTKALFDAVTEAVKLPEDQRGEALAKSFEDFQEVLSDVIAEDMHGAFALGMKGDVRRLIGTDEGEMAKSDVAPVAEFGSLIKAVEAGVTLMKSDARFKEDLVPLIDEWVVSGRALLAASINEPLAKSEAESNIQKEEAAALRAQIQTAVDALRKRAVNLVKDDSGDPTDQGDGDGSDSEDPSDMDPLEVIGRLAAAILVQIDALMGNDQTDDSSDQTDQGDQTQVPPPAQKAEEVKDLQKSNEPAKTDEGKDLTKLEAENKELKEQLAKFNAQPAAPKGNTKLVITDKTGDNSLSKVEEEDKLKKKAEELAKMSPQERTVELTKIALSRPLKVM